MTPTLNFTTGTEGAFDDMSDADYRAAAGVSNSMLTHIAPDGEEAGSPAHFIEALTHPQPDSDALFTGRMVHSMILTPGAPLPGIVEIPETYPAPASHLDVKSGAIKAGDPLKWTGNAKFCKAWLAHSEAAGLRPVKTEQREAIEGMVKAVADDPNCQIIFKRGKPEVSLFKRYYRGDGMILRKGRVDWVPPGPILPDIKSCQDARQCDFASVIFKRRYYVQAAYYLDLHNDLHPDDQKTGFALVAVEKFPPYAIQIHLLTAEDIQEGRWEYQKNLALVMECQRQDVWQKYSDKIVTTKMRVPFGKGKTVLQD